MVAGLRPGLGVIEPEIALLAKPDFIADTLVETNGRAAERDIYRLPPGRAHAAGVLLARTEPAAQVDIDHSDLEPPLGQAHRDGTADDAAAYQDHVVAFAQRHDLSRISY